MTPPSLDAPDVFTTCISRIRDKGLKSRMTAVAGDVGTASDDYKALATKNRLHRFPRSALVGGNVTAAEMEAVYTQRMARKGAPGRDIYDEIFASARSGRCPLCAHRLVSTLDHHLPKAHYPVLSVVPLNLVPACSDCNKAKLASLPNRASEEALHPYFDDIGGDRWLYADVVEDRPATLSYRVQCPEHWDEVLADRVDLHFRMLGLGHLYAAQGADELLNIRHQLESLHQIDGPQLVRSELRARARSSQAALLNGWRTAAYEAFASSDWFCDGGFSGH